MSGTNLTNILCTAAENGDVAKLRECIESVGNAVDVNCCDKKRYTALHKACSKGHLNCVKYLIGKGANINSLAERKITPLHLATEGYHVEIVELLIEKFADVNQSTSSGGDTPLHWLVKNTPDGKSKIEEMQKILKILHHHGAKLDLKNEEDETALHLACKHTEYTEIVKRLLQLGADANVMDQDSKTPHELAKLLHGPEALICKVFEKNSMMTDGWHDARHQGQTAAGIEVPKELVNLLRIQRSCDVQTDGCSGLASPTDTPVQAYQERQRGNMTPFSPEVPSIVFVNIENFQPKNVTVGQGGVLVMGDNTSVNQTASPTNTPSQSGQ